MTCHAGRLAQTASHTSKFRVLKIKSQPVTTRRRRAFCAHEEVRKLDRFFLKSSLILHTRLKLAEALPTTSMSIVQRPTCLDLATLPCHGTPRPACHWFEESCRNTAAATTQVHPAPCQSPPSKVKVVGRQEQWRARSDRPAPSAALLCRASSLAPA